MMRKRHLRKTSSVFNTFLKMKDKKLCESRIEISGLSYT